MLTDGSFIEENHSNKTAQKNSQNNQRPRPGQAPQEMMQYWGTQKHCWLCLTPADSCVGYKFETLSVLPRPWAEVSRDAIESREHAIVNNHAQYCSVVRTNIGTTSLVIAGEVDCVLGSKPRSPEDPIPWLELKTSADLQDNSPRELVKFERKLLRYWAQSFLLGVPSIAVGFRTPDGFVTRILELSTQKIPTQVKQGRWTWDGNVSINFTAAFLDLLKRTVTGDGVWRIRRVKGQKVIEILKVEESGTGNIVKDSFKKHRERLRALEISAALGK